MGFFENIIADSRLPLRAVSSSVAVTVDPTGVLHEPWQIDDARATPAEGSLGEPPALYRDFGPNPAPTPAIASDSPLANDEVRETGGHGPVPAERPVPVSRRAMVPDESDTVPPGDVQPGQLSEAPSQASTDLPGMPDRGISAASGPRRVLRQVRAPGIVSVIPEVNGEASLPGSPAAESRESPILPGSAPGQAIPLARVLPSSEWRSRSSIPQASTVSRLSTSEAAENDTAGIVKAASVAPSAEVKPMMTRPHLAESHEYDQTSVAPPLPLSGERTSPGESQYSTPQAPQVRIGQVNVIVEAPATPPALSPVSRTEDLSSRLFLRGL